MTGKERIEAMLEGLACDRLPFMPITMMFAADQIGRSYYEYATDFRVLVEGQLRTSEVFEIDYVSCISDPAREAADCGAPINFHENLPPSNDEANALLKEKADLTGLQMPDPEGGGRMTDRLRAAELFRESVAGLKIIEGWIEGPCAEAADLRGINRLMLDFYDDPPFVRELFEFVTGMAVEFARAQVKAGVDLIGIGDAAASLVGPRIYKEFVFPCEKRLVEAVSEMGVAVRLHICGNTRSLLESLGELGCSIVDLDYMVPLWEARKAMGDRQVLLGNLDPVNAVLNGNPEEIERGLCRCFEEAGARYIVGAGCEIPRGTPAENLHAMRRFAESVSGGFS